MKGLMHVYYGDGKGKSTASFGLMLRAAGSGKSACIVQFFKGTPCGELKSFEKLGISVLRCECSKFVFKMNDEEKAELKNRHDRILAEALNMASDILVLDEGVDALYYGLVDEELFRRVVFERPEGTELILTGHKKVDWIFDAADYITHMKKEKHPYDNGIRARRGIEF